MTALAERAFAASRARDKVEDELGDVLSEACGEGNWEDFQWDYYDASLEVYGVTERESVDLAPIRAAGFARVWLHAGGQVENGWPCSLGVGSCPCRSILLVEAA